MRKRLLLGVLVVLMTMVMTGCCLSHEWQDASCTEPKTCTKCQEVEGEALGHTWVDANCTEAKKCNVCGETEGEALGHAWVEATYETPKTCNVCKTTEGDALSVKADEYYEKGRNFLYGLEGNEINLELAYSNFEQAKEIGKVDANFYLGLLCDEYNYPKQDYELAKSYYEACMDNPYAQIELGEFFYEGQGVEEDKEKAEAMWQAVIDSGYVEGYGGMALIAFYAGDYETAFESFNKMMEGKEQIYTACAMADIGYLYEYGTGVEQDFSKALEWYEKAADLGNTDAMNNIGIMYHRGDVVEQDYAKALEWYMKAVDLGNPTAMYNVGNAYKFGCGVEQDYAKTLEWYEKAADAGKESAMTSIGYMYGKGQGVKQDYTKELEWYEKAADAGSATAMYNIGYMYEYGEGVEQDFSKALEWYEKSADAGDEDANEAVERIKRLLK